MRRNRKGTRWRRLNLRRFIPFMIFLLAGLFALCMLADYALDSVKRSRENTQLSEDYSLAFIPAAEEGTAIGARSESKYNPVPMATQQPGMLVKYRSLSGEIPEQARKLYKLNNDLVGWLYVQGAVDLPVVYRDNEYYLTHAFNDEEDSGGTLFLDENHPLKEGTQNLVIHGHAMYDGSMFGSLGSFTKLTTVKNRPFAQFSTMYAPEDYVIFAVLRVNPDPSSEDYFPYIGKERFANADDFNNYVNGLRERSMHEIPVEVLPDDALLTLATCVGDDRLVVVYRRFRDGETKEELQAQVDLAWKK